MTLDELLESLRGVGTDAATTGSAIGKTIANAATPDIMKATPEQGDKAEKFLGKALASTVAPVALPAAAAAEALLPAHLDRKEKEAARLQGQSQGAGSGVGVNADEAPPTPPAAPPPAPLPVKKGVGAPVMQMPEMDIQGRVPSAVGDMSAPKPMPAPSQAPPAEAEHKPSAQEEYAAALQQAHGLDTGVGTGLLRFLSGFSSKGDEFRKDINNRVNAPVQELLAQKKYLDEREAKAREDEKYAKEKSLDDPMSQQSKQAQMLMQLRGVDPKLAMSLPASALPSILSATHANDEAKHQLDLIKQEDLNRASREHEGAATRGNAYAIAKMNNESDLEGKRLGAHGQAPNQQQMNLAEVKTHAANIHNVLNALRERIKSNGTYDLVGPHNKQLQQDVDSLAQDYAKIVDPKSVNRESEIAAARKMLVDPSPWQQDSSALASLDNFEKLVNMREQNFNWANGAPGASQASQVTSAGSSAGAPHGPSIVQNGHTYNWNPSTGKYE